MSYQVDKCQVHNLDKLYINLEKQTQKYMKMECIQCTTKESISIEEILMKMKQMSFKQSKILQNQQIMVEMKNIVQQSNFVLQSFQQMHQTIQDQHDKWLKIHTQFEEIQKFQKSSYYNQDDLRQIAQITLNSNLMNVFIKLLCQSYQILHQINQIIFKNQLLNFNKLIQYYIQTLQMLRRIPNQQQIWRINNYQNSEPQVFKIKQKISNNYLNFNPISLYMQLLLVLTIQKQYRNIFDILIIIGGGNYNHGQNKNLMVLNLCDDTKLSSETILYGHSKRVTSISYSKKDHFFVSGSLDFTLRLWKYEIKNQNWDCIKQLSKHTSTINNQKNYHKLSISCGHDSKIFIWKNVNQNWSESQTISDHVAAVNSISFSEDNTLLASGSEDSNVYIWKNDYDVFSKIGQIDVPCSSFIYCVHFIKYNSLIVGTYDGNISIWQINQNKYELCFEVNPKFGYIKKIVYNENRALIITKCEHRTIIWKIINNDKIEQIKQYEGEYLGIGISQGPSIIAMFNCEKKELELLSCNL